MSKIKLMKLLFILSLLCSFIFSCASNIKPIVRWSSPESSERLVESKAKVDFFKLSANFTPQTDSLVCGPTSGAIVLNALRLKSGSKVLPKTQFKARYKRHLPKSVDPTFSRYTPQNFINPKAKSVKTWAQLYGQPINGKKDFGLQIGQFYQILKNHDLNVQLRVVGNKMSSVSIKKELIKNLKTPDDYVLVNYARKSLGQKGGGHISPIGAYHKASDSFLIMDVNPNKDEWIWVQSDLLISAMRTFDTVQNRGYLLIKEKS